MSIRDKVDAIIEAWRDCTPRVYLPPGEWQAFLDEMKPCFADSLYGSPIADEQASKEGYANFMYHGFAICCEKPKVP